MSGASLLGFFLFLMIVGTPIAVALGGTAIISSLMFRPIPMEIVGQKLLDNIDHFTLMAVPFFFFAASLMETGGLVRRLVNLANALVGRWTGGLGITGVLSCMMFAAISGSSAATVAAVGKVMFPSLVKEGYSPRYAIGALATAGSLGILIPPSIPMILYGFVTETSISRLFIAGIIPGIIYGTGLMLMARFLAGREKVKPRPAIGRAEIGQAFASAGPALLLPAFIFIGIYGLPSFSIFGIEHDGGGIFTPTEAAVMSTALALIIGILVYKEMTLRGAVGTILTTAPTVGMVFFITTNALLFAFVVTQFGIPQLVANTLVDMNMPPWLFLLLVNIVLIFVGFFLEGTPTILMLVPILFPAAVQLGIDPIHFCIIVVVNIELGLVTPPVGFNLFVGSSISGLPVAEVFKAVLPWMSVTIAVLLLVTYVPELSLFLPNLIFN